MKCVCEDFCEIITGMPVEIYDFYLPGPYHSSFIVQKALRGDAWHDLQYDMFTMSTRNQPPGISVIVINSNIILKCHMFCGAAKPLVIPLMTRESTAEGEAK